MPTVNTALGEVETTPFPDRVVKVGDRDPGTVRKIQHRLNSIGCGPVPEDGVFDQARTKKAVRLFQARFPDVTGTPLVIDGEVGSLTWGALFGSSTVPYSSTAPTRLTQAAIDFAVTQIGVMEEPMGSNSGPEVDAYLAAVGLKPGFAWCVAFTHYCYKKATEELGIANPHIRTAGVLEHWNKAAKEPKIRRVTNAEAVAQPALVRPGSLHHRSWTGFRTFWDGHPFFKRQTRDHRR